MISAKSPNPHSMCEYNQIHWTPPPHTFARLHRIPAEAGLSRLSSLGRLPFSPASIGPCIARIHHCLWSQGEALGDGQVKTVEGKRGGGGYLRGHRIATRVSVTGYKLWGTMVLQTTRRHEMAILQRHSRQQLT